jgi:hypothetical protein
MSTLFESDMPLRFEWIAGAMYPKNLLISALIKSHQLIINFRDLSEKILAL